MKDLTASNNDIIKDWELKYVPEINAEKNRLGIKSNRKYKAKQSKAKNFTASGGEINKIGISMNKGEIFTHKGKGRYPQNRKEKPWFNPITEKRVSELGDLIAENTGDVICGNILIR